jgi:hypothetical protein
VLDIVLEHVKDPNHLINELPEQSKNCSIHIFQDEYQEASFIVDNIKAALAKAKLILKSSVISFGVRHNKTFKNIENN